MQDEVIHAAHPFPTERFTGVGIVIAAGGPRYCTCAWVCLTMLRPVLGCDLPIQVWYLGPNDMSAEMIELLRLFDVEGVDALAVRERFPTGWLGGWELKPYAILNRPFREESSLGQRG
jgi:alpha 1,2-mannosyltransferase